MSEKIKILYVDDEENNLVSFRANFRKDYDVYVSNSANNAFLILEKETIQIIISDQRMPNISGVEFLEQTIKLSPDSIRLLITAYSDIDLVIEAINRGQVTKYIQKPWDFEKLSLAIDHCVTIYKSKIELQLKNKELQKTNSELNKFVYSISHDLRSPLTSILGIINLSKVIPETKGANQYFEMIENSVLKLDVFIKNLINHYKNSNYIEIKENIDFKSLIITVWETFKHQNTAIDFKISIDQSQAFFGDSFRLKIIFENIISNAIKYQNVLTEIHVININMQIEERQAKITISDNGIGIEEKYLSSIFNLFFRTEESTQAEGTGIGLYLVKEAIDKIGGEIRVSSIPLQGTSFELIIPNKKIYE